MKENTAVLLVASKEIDLEVNAEKTEYVFMSHHQNAGRNHNIKAISFKYTSQLKYFEMTQTNQNCIYEETMSGLNSGNACCHSVQV
jgi:hypothetical protein